MQSGNTSDRARDLAEGTVFNEQFEVGSYVAEGGMGFIYRGTRLPENHPVAIKVMRDELSSDTTCVKRFQREAKAVSRLEHPNTITLFDFGFDEGAQLMYIAMEWLEGADLSEHLSESGPLPPKQAAVFAYQAALSLEEAHDKNIIHRDLKPENIFLLAEGEDDERIRVLDFGIAKMVNEPAQTQITRIGMVCGTPEYMSPEQARGEELDGRSDIYALGCVLYAFLTGKPPFESDNPLHVIMHHQLEPLPTLPETIPPMLRKIVARCTAKERDQRFASAQELAGALRAFIDDELHSEAALGLGETVVMEQVTHDAEALGETTELPEVTPAPETPAPQHSASPGHSETITGLTAAAPARSSSGPLLVLLAVVVAVGGVIAFLLLREDTASTPPTQDPPPQPTSPPPTSTPPIPTGTLTITLQSDVPGAIVIGPNGAALGPPPLEVPNTDGISGAFEILAEGYEPARIEVQLEPGETTEQVAQLTPLPQATPLPCVLTVSPPDASVAFRGTPVPGTSPFTVELEAGKKGTLQIEKAGFQSITHTLEGRPECSERFTLEKASKGDSSTKKPTEPREAPPTQDVVDPPKEPEHPGFKAFDEDE